MKTRVQTLVTSVALTAGVFCAAGNAQAQDGPQTCQPGIFAAYTGINSAQYQLLIGTLIPAAGSLIGDFNTTASFACPSAPAAEAAYATLLANANTVRTSIPSGRVLITLPDGTVVLDTSRSNNTFANFCSKTINENHNSRVAILAAQEYQCGLGLVSKRSSSTGTNEAYFALRAGGHLDSIGTIRISQVAP
jgi:hypothetical protein